MERWLVLLTFGTFIKGYHSCMLLTIHKLYIFYVNILKYQYTLIIWFWRSPCSLTCSVNSFNNTCKVASGRAPKTEEEKQTAKLKEREHEKEESILKRVHQQQQDKGGELYIEMDWNQLSFESAGQHFGCVPLGWSGSGSVIQDHSDHGRSNGLMNPCPE